MFMKTLLKIELERAFKNKWFYITLLIELVLVLVDIATVVLPVRMAYEDFYIPLRDNQIPGAYCLWMAAHCSPVYKLLHLMFPLLISIPYTYTIYNDKKSNYIYNITCRISKKKYYISKLITQFMVGTLVVAFCLTSSFILTAMVLPLENPTLGSFEYAFTNHNVFSTIYYKHTFLAVILFIILESLVFGIIGCIGFVFAYLMNNVIMVMLSTFIIYYMDFIISNLCGRYGSLMLASKVAIIYKNWAAGFVIELLIIVVVEVVMCVVQMNKKDII